MKVSGWGRVPLGDFVTLRRGHDLPDAVRRPGNTPILGSFGITGWHDESRAAGPGVTVGRSGASLGVVNFSPVDYWPLNTALYVTDFHGNDRRFAYYFLKQFDFRSYNSGSAQPSLNRNFIHPILVDVPPVCEQRAIAHVLGTLDDKIDLNRLTNRTLEEMARALFKSWFVDFDPVHAKATLKHYAATFTQGEGDWSVERARAYLDRMDADIATLFPDSFVDSELGPIPAGWVLGCFGDIIVQRKQKIGARTAVVLSAVRTGRLVRSEEHFTKQVHSKSIVNYLAVEHGDIAYNPSRINIGSVGMLKEAFLGAVSPVYVVARPKSAYRWFFDFALRLTQTKQWITVLATGSVRQSLSYVDFASIPCAIPPLSVVEQFEGQWNRLQEATVAHSEEVLTITAQRDVLLPKLLSGKVRVSGGTENSGR